MKRKLWIVVLTLTMVFGMVLSASAELPPNPKVVDPRLFQEIGQYGGDLILSLPYMPRGGAIDSASNIVFPWLRDPLIEENPVTGELEPALAESWEVSEDGLEVIFHLRKVKWSDGEPFTADDVIFTFVHREMDPHNPSNQMARYTIGDGVVTWEKIDDHTVKANLPAPYGAFFRVLTHSRMIPKHRLMDWVPAYNPAAEPGSIGLANWNPDIPIEAMAGTGPFRVVSFNEQQVVLERNPYSWRVDAEGNQLPYVDRLVYLIVPNDQVKQAKFMAGELDHIELTPGMYPTLKKAEIDGSPFRVFRGEPVNPTPSPPHWSFNFDIEDAELREVFRDVRFRTAMAHAIDYDRIIDQIYNTLAIRSGVPVLPANKAFFNPEIEGMRPQFDLAKTAAILDELGIVDIDGDGIRELKSGRDFEFVLTSAVNIQPHNDIAAMLQDDLAKIGVKIHLQLLDSTLVGDKALAGEFESMIHAYGNQPDPQLRKAIWQPSGALYYWHRSTMAQEGKPNLDEMYDWEREIFDLFELGQIEMDQAKRKEYYDRWQVLNATYFPVIFIVKGMDISAVQNTVGNAFQTEDGVTVFVPYTVFKK
jgi:peptide/nickel transport system substrate-binding protein